MTFAKLPHLDTKWQILLMQFVSTWVTCRWLLSLIDPLHHILNQDQFITILKLTSKKIQVVYLNPSKDESDDSNLEWEDPQ